MFIKIIYSYYSAKDIIAHRQKLIKLADSSELGWKVANEYDENPLADDSEDEKRIYRAEARANKKHKAAQSKRKQTRYKPYMKKSTETNIQTTNNKPGLCFSCGRAGHWKKDCTENRTFNKLSITRHKTCITSSIVNDLSIKESYINISNNTKPAPLYADISDKSSINNAALSQISPVGSLKKHLNMWKSCAGDYIVDIIQNGYKLPFKTVPPEVCLNNNKSARDNAQFVQSEIFNLLNKGVITQVNFKPLIVNPLTVAYNKTGKPRLVLDCRHINSHLHLFKVKFDDIRVAKDLFAPNYYYFTFDLKSAYHHIEIFNEHRRFLGFSWFSDGATRYYVFNALPFGISSAGHIFTKVTRVFITYVRSKGHKVIMYLDDGIGGHLDYRQALNCSVFVQDTLSNFGFLKADEKCSWIPLRKVTWLGHYIDSLLNCIFITEERIKNLESSIQAILNYLPDSKQTLLHVRRLASVVGQIISLQYVLGSVVRLRTRYMYACILTRASWNAPVILSEQACTELKFWYKNCRTMNNVGKSLECPSSCDISLYCDASADGYGGYLIDHRSEANIPAEEGYELPEVSISFDEIYGKSDYKHQCIEKYSETKPDNVVFGSWSQREMLFSSTWRETEAVGRIIKSKINVMKSCSVKVYSDNMNVKSVLSYGSSKADLQSISVDINDFCNRYNVQLQLEWIPRSQNELADHLSRCKDSDDWFISKHCFTFLDNLWGTHTIDRFSAHYNNNCERFNSKWWVPQTLGINAFDQTWSNENNWIVPPPKLILKCINKLKKEQATGTLVVPKWKSADFWPCIYKGSMLRSYIIDMRVLPRQNVICKGRGNNGIFVTVNDTLPFDMMAVRIKFGSNV